MSGIFTGVGSPGTISLASGGFFLGFSLSISPQQILSYGPARRKITFHNPGTVDAYVAPLYTQNSGQDVQLNPSPSALAGCFLIFANGGSLTIEGEVQKPWQAFSATGSGNPLTVVPSNV